jgi:VWFA-related protein
MRESRWAFSLMLSVAMFCVSSVVGAQQSPAPAANGQAQSQKTPDQSHPELSHRPAPRPGAPAGKIQIDVVVTDGTGRAVAGLQQQDFTLSDNKKPRPILSFRAVDGSTGQLSGAGNGTNDGMGNGIGADLPVEVILLIDATNNSLQNIVYERSQVATFLRQNGGHLAQPVTLMIFSEQGVKLQPRASTDGNMLADWLDKSESTFHTVPRSGGYDAIERRTLSMKTLRSIAEAETPKPGRKMLLWIGPGWPMLQSSAYLMSATMQRNLFNVIIDTSRALREARITMYLVNPMDPQNLARVAPDYYKGFLKGVSNAGEADSADLAAPIFAVHSGGRVVNEGDDLVRDLNSCMADAKAYYTIGFDPLNADHPNEYHALEVKVDKPSVKARTNTGYYSEPLPKP